MDLKHTFELYEDVKNDMKFFISSDVRIKILMSLKEGPKNLADLRNEIHLSSSTILHGMNQLQGKDIILRDSGKYSLSQMGKMAANKIINLMETVNTLKNCKDLFLNHEVDCIPKDLIKDIGCLNNSTLVSSTVTDVMKPHRVLSQFLMDTTNIKYLSPVFYPKNAEMFVKTMEKDGKVDLVVTSGVLDKLKEILGTEEVQKSISSGNWGVRIADDDLKLSLTMGDEFIAMGLFSTDGSYDLNVFLISHDEEAISWGERLFKHYKYKSEELKI
ncbi:helix-turn-helix transcriptional regulator [Methanobacterium aggregans]|uniref:helix-turn-helix transcriptional regulator n=1 Tax=Methanobacterium aggregans TaxID=1615586 RepID=UPI001AEAE63E|nr:transcriptional regulator FilR1 domain-containing protein [Methanobacterium aggregans]MBP2046965.1 putative transcriptional regulator [Methanobacterium aggregans]